MEEQEHAAWRHQLGARPQMQHGLAMPPLLVIEPSLFSSSSHGGPSSSVTAAPPSACTSTTPSSATTTTPYAAAAAERARACSQCRQAHNACDSTRPCRRCVRMGLAEQCHDAPVRKRGRPRGIKPMPATASLPSPSVSPDPREASRPRPRESKRVKNEGLHVDGTWTPGPEDQGRNNVGGECRPGPEEASDGAIGMLARAVQVLAAEVKNLRLENQQLWGQMTGMHERQRHLDLAMATFLSSSSSTSSTTAHSSFASSLPTQTPHHWSTSTPSSTSSSPSPPHSLRPEGMQASQSAYAQDRSLLELGHQYHHDRDRYVYNLLGHSEGDFQQQRQFEVPPAQPWMRSDDELLLSRVRDQLWRDMPFLRDYSFDGREFAIPGPGYPVVAGTLTSVFDNKPPSIVFYNQAMAELTQYSWHELLGRPMSTIAVMNEAALPQLASILTNRTPMSVSRLHRFNHLFRTRTGRLIRMVDNTQFFFDQKGNAKHVIMCALSWEEGHIRQGEVVDQWAPLVDSRSLCAPSPHPPHPHHHHHHPHQHQHQQHHPALFPQSQPWLHSDAHAQYQKPGHPRFFTPSSSSSSLSPSSSSPSPPSSASPTSRSPSGMGLHIQHHPS